MAKPSTRVAILHHQTMASGKEVDDTRHTAQPVQRCGQCRFYHTHGTVLCLVCTSGVQARLYTDADIEARLKARRQAYKEQRATKLAAAHDELALLDASSSTL